MADALFGYKDQMSYEKLSKSLIQLKQVSSDVTDITPLYRDPKLVEGVRKRTPIYELLDKEDAPESTFRWVEESADNFAKYTTESNAASRFAAQKGTYTEGSVTTRLLSYVLNVGMMAQRNTEKYVDLMRIEQMKAMLGIRKAVERSCIIGNPTGGVTDGGATDALGFAGLEQLITTNVDNPSSAEAISLPKIDAQMDALVDLGVSEDRILIVTDARTKTAFAQLFYNTYNTPVETHEFAPGLNLTSYRGAAVVSSSYMPTTTQQREMIFIDRDTTTIPEFWKPSQIELGKTELSDDSVAFWMGALAVKKESYNAIIKKIV